MKYGKRITSIGLLCVVMWSCSEDDTNNYALPDSTVTLAQSAGSSSEGSGTYLIPVRLNTPQEGQTYVSFRLEGNATVGNTAHPSTDVRLMTESPLVIEAGETEAFIRVELLEDNVFEAVTERFTVTLGSVVKGNARLDTRQTTYTHTLEENDYELTLSWETEGNASGKATSGIADLDLIVEQPNSIYVFSDSEAGFERLLLTNVSAQDSYRVNVWYYQGEADVRYTLTYRAADVGERVLAEGTFTSHQANQEFDPAQTSSVQNFRLVPEGQQLNVR